MALIKEQEHFFKVYIFRKQLVFKIHSNLEFGNK